MDRRNFLNGALLFTLGLGTATGIYRSSNPDPSFLPLDAEKQLLSFYDPSYASLDRLFPEVRTYAQGLLVLEQRGLLVKGELFMERLEALAQTDPIIDFLGWQHLESELRVYHAAHLLVAESMGERAGMTMNRGDGFTQFLSGIDIQGEALKAYSVKSNSDTTAAVSCRELCRHEPECHSFTLGLAANPLPEKRHVCWLVHGTPRMVRTDGYLAGIRLK